MTEISNVPALALGPWAEFDISQPAVDLGADVLSEMKNTFIDLSGAIKTRGGYAKYISSALESGAPSIVGVNKHRFSASSSAVWCVAEGGDFYEAVSGTGTDRSPGSGISFTAGDDKTIVSTNANGTLIACNGRGNLAPIKWTAAGGNIAAAGVGSSNVTSCEAVAYWNDRLWYLGSNVDERYAHFSARGTITSFGVNDYYYGDTLCRMALPIQNYLAMYTTDGIWGLTPTGNSEDPYALSKKSPVGTTCRRGILALANGLHLFIREDGIYAWDGGGLPAKISRNLDGAEKGWVDINLSALDDAFAIDVKDRNQAWFFVPDGSGQTLMNKVYVWNYLSNRWVGIFSDFTRICGAYFDATPHLGGSSDGLVWKHDTGTNDDSSAMDCQAATAAPPPMGLSQTVQWVFGRCEFEAQAESSSLSVQQSGPTAISDVDIIEVGDPSDALVTDFVIGSSGIRGSDVAYTADFDLNGFDPMTKVRFFNNTIDRPWVMRRCELNYVPMGKHGIGELGII